MLKKRVFLEKASKRICLLDGATGTALMAAGMPKGCCKEQWILENPETMIELQRRYAAAGSEIIYAPTFQSNPPALAAFGLDHQTEEINARLVGLSRSAAPGCLIAGNLTTMKMYMDSGSETNFDRMAAAYRRQIRGLLKGGADLLVAETLLYPIEARAVLAAAEAEGAETVLCSFTMKADGTLYSGEQAGDRLSELEQAGAAAIGFNCVAMSEQTPMLVRKLRTQIQGLLLCKPNAGIPAVDASGAKAYPVTARGYAELMGKCVLAGANLIGGCCGTTPEYIAEIRKCLSA